MVETIFIINSDKDNISIPEFVRELEKRITNIEKILEIVVKRKVNDNETIINAIEVLQ